ncbi:hypothetical protein PRZ48_009043 [Zasmidium cellare]|uniref:Uncharacterized protein n=1 Tax=Zasmidium cellare TaxID=395010 RepID=A0ABR0EH51_ZASCE|nr:hypothetical protein PRZ48_009043 [Zasmidium cellare]
MSSTIRRDSDKIPVLNIAACLDATLEQLNERVISQAEASNELEWTKQLRVQKMRASVMNQVAQIPPELTDSVSDIAGQQHSPIEVQNESYDWVLVAARMVIGESSSAPWIRQVHRLSIYDIAHLSAQAVHELPFLCWMRKSPPRMAALAAFM